MVEGHLRHEKHLFFGVVLAGLLGVVFFYHTPVVSVSEEAMVRTGVGHDLLAGAVEGRQGLIGSLKWPPLPTLLILPFVKLPLLGTTGLAFPVVNAIIAAFTLTLLNTWWRRFGVPRVARYALLCLYQISPPVIGAVLTGSSATVMLLLLMAGAYFLVHWLVTLDVRSLAYMGVLGGLAILTRYQAILLVMLAAALVPMRIRRDRTPSFRGATLLVFLIPGLYSALLWFMGNWLIMGDPVFFLRGLAGRTGFLAELTELDVEWHLYMMPLLLLLMGWALRAGVAGKAHAVFPRPARENGRAGERRELKVDTAETLVHGDGTGRRMPPLLRSTLYFLLSAGRRKSITVWGAVAVILAVAGWPYVTELYPAEGQEPYFARHHREFSQVDEIRTYLAERPEVKVFVSGYTGYPFVTQAHDPDQFVHLMNLDLREIERRTRGQRLFFLVPRPRGVYRWEDVNLQAPWLFKDYMKHVLAAGNLRFSFVLQKEWRDWHLVEAVRAENTGP